ncbi:hypothetical protein [Mycolicibacterium iranicum]|uniref:Porin n=1 Tax=Mycolicibacterium iranicum TaxID=912594 RepID=A0A1X1WRH5_MYCIR|nr:hypothetical protein [Mycolicibacterium iranicum]MCZ0727872.1 hypothetical protein [Mycolicibacterium iranicum]ORV89112.1 hypothetical protein AWC12_10905 [Mycolicibacterium iranicum]
MLVGKIQTNKSRVIAGAIAAAAVALPLYASLTTADTENTAAPRCLAWFGNQADGHCLSYSNGTGATIGTPQVGLGEGGIYFETPPLLPGTTINRGIGQWGN